MYVESENIIHSYWQVLERRLQEYLRDSEVKTAVASQFLADEILDERDRVLEAIRQGSTI